MAASSLIGNASGQADKASGSISASRSVSASSPWSGMVATSLGIEPATFADFSGRMASHGISLDTSRLFFDPVYAYRRFALAHATDDDALKALTVDLFERYKALERRRRSVSAFSRPH